MRPATICVALGTVSRERFFHENMLAGFDRRQRDWQMEEVWNGDADKIDIGIREQFFVAGVDFGDIVFGGECVAAISIESCDRDHLRPGVGRISGDMERGDATANNADLHLSFSHLLVSAFPPVSSFDPNAALVARIAHTSMACVTIPFKVKVYGAVRTVISVIAPGRVCTSIEMRMASPVSSSRLSR